MTAASTVFSASPIIDPVNPGLGLTSFAAVLAPLAIIFAALAAVLAAELLETGAAGTTVFGTAEGDPTIASVIAPRRPPEPGVAVPGTEDPGIEDPGTEDPGTEDPGTQADGVELKSLYLLVSH